MIGAFAKFNFVTYVRLVTLLLWVPANSTTPVSAFFKLVNWTTTYLSTTRQQFRTLVDHNIFILCKKNKNNYKSDSRYIHKRTSLVGVIQFFFCFNFKQLFHIYYPYAYVYNIMCNIKTLDCFF